jgi:hypothetical protein
MGPSAAIEDQTFGSTPGAVLKLKGKDGIITWKIPELALYAGTNVTWKIHKLRGKSKHPLIGDIVYLKTVIGGKQKPQKISSSGPDFEFRWPTGGKDTFNLAVGEVAIGADGAEGDVTWTVVAPKNVDAGLKEAYFYLHDVGPILYLHATSAAATESAAAPAQ